MIKSITTLVIFSAGFNAGFAQENGATINSEEKPFIAAPLGLVEELPVEGTYQVVFKNGSGQREIQDEILFQINIKRESENLVIITIDENTEIRVLPYSIINSENFQKVTKLIFE